MSWALEAVVNELAAEIKSAGIEVNQPAMVIVTRHVAIRLPRNKDTAFYRKVIKNEINKAEELKAAKIRAKQTTLL